MPKYRIVQLKNAKYALQASYGFFGLRSWDYMQDGAGTWQFPSMAQVERFMQFCQEEDGRAAGEEIARIVKTL